MIVLFILTLSILLQFVAAFMALRLMPLTGRRAAWSLISAALMLMALRRCVPLIRMLSGDELIRPDFNAELIALMISLLLVVGISRIAPIFTDRKRAAEALIESEEKFRKAFYTSPDSVNINRLEDGMYTAINSGFTKITGYTEEDIIGKTSTECNIWENVEDRQSLVARLKKDGDASNIEAAFRMKRGDIRYGLMSASVIDLNGVPHILSVTRDITDRKRAEEALKESETKYRLLADNVNDVIFVLNMNLNYTYVSPSVKILRGYESAEVLKQQPFETLTPASWDLAMRTVSEVIELEKSEQREISISRTLQLEMNRKDGTTVWTEVKLSFIRDEHQQPIGILGVTRDITDRKQAKDELQRSLDSLRKAFGATIQVMVSAVEARDPYTAGHQIRSTDLARAIATEMKLSPDRIDGIRMAGSIHDIGKLSIPAELLSKPTKLLDIEFALIKEHSRKGYEMLKDVESPWPLAQIVYQHHERMNGSGYPRNLKGDEILMEARILAVADVVESMASHRPYRPALGIEAALEEIEKNKGTLYDDAVADACIRLFREKRFQFAEK
ncbi:MAG: PAS domain S-box protein [Deltaproteobacteria bacterium]|nr:PAS domain S-box protein [Deltaproteobacteria bacterium]